MTSTGTGIKALLAPIWQEVSSLWSGAEFAFLDTSSYGDDQESPSAAFQDVIPGSQSGVDAQYGHCC
jgi:hypothetical protein